MSGQPEFEMTSGRTRTADDCCIVSCGIGPHYQEGLYSTRLHCEVNVPEAWRLFYRELPLGCPPHREQMYAFKIRAMQRAIEAGFRYILWMDATFQPLSSIEPLWSVIRERGWYVAPQGHATLGEWASDFLLFHFGITRDSAMKIPLVYSGLVGLDMGNEMGKTIWSDWVASQVAGTWNGAHYNEPGASLRPFGLKTKGQVSEDPRVSGHRHDEAALSAILMWCDLVPTDMNFLTLESPNGFIGHRVPLVIPAQRRPEPSKKQEPSGYLSAADLQRMGIK